MPVELDGEQNTDQCAGTLGQRLLEEYERRGHLDAQIARALIDLVADRGDPAAGESPRRGAVVAKPAAAIRTT